MRRSCTLAPLLFSGLFALPLAAQTPTTPPSHSSMDGMTNMQHAAAPTSAAARIQIDSVARALKPLGTPSAASAAGYRPVFGWIPTMGVHWIDPLRMTKAAESERAAPGQLLFSRIAGRDSLVGAAYGYFTLATDSTPPRLFADAPPWHEHADLAPGGQTLLMLHVWFVPSPDGPFAGTNPNLPFWAVGLDAPDSARMHDPAFSQRVRRASLALAEVADTTAIFPTLKARDEVRAVLVPRRDSIRALIPELRAAQQARDTARWDRAAERVAAQWDALAATYLASARSASGKQRIARYIAMVLGQHGE
jgi:hypothetical protein